MTTTIRVESLSKRYRLGQVGGTTLREDWQRWTARLRGLPDPTLKVTESNVRDHKGRSEYVWALKDINFEVKQGEALGIIGKNGAGKSTLLKILSRVTAPTQGQIKIKGRIASLLEVGTGFHPELTGRENIFLNGAVLGMTRAEVSRKLDEIIAFSGCERYIDTPVKRYSSGMTVRLGFAVAAHLEPEILIVDEVLAVGDAEFQKKCLGKMKDVAGHGRTVLFVSHNMVAVNTLCTRALLLADGGLVAQGPASEMVARYVHQSENAGLARSWQDDGPSCCDGAFRVKEVRVAPVRDGAGPITMQTPIQVITDFEVLSPLIRAAHITYHLLNDQGIVVLATNCRPTRHTPGAHRAEFSIPGDLLNSGGYALRLLLVENGNQVISTTEDVVSFDVADTARRDTAYSGRRPGVVQPPLKWRIECHTVPASAFQSGGENDPCLK